MPKLQQENKYGISLKRLQHKEIELVRTWRNSNAIAAQMEYKAHISATQQEAWFLEINKSLSAYYFMIYVVDKPIGLIHLNQINRDEKTAHAGLFIGDASYLGTGVVLGASLLLLQFAFEQNDLNSVYAKVNKANTAAINYNQLLGFQKLHEINAQFELFELQKERFAAKKNQLEQLASMVKMP